MACIKGYDTKAGMRKRWDKMYENVQKKERKERERQWRREGEAKRRGINTLFSGRSIVWPLGTHKNTHK